VTRKSGLPTEKQIKQEVVNNRFVFPGNWHLYGLGVKYTDKETRCTEYKILDGLEEHL
jgi:hypothetical protein